MKRPSWILVTLVAISLAVAPAASGGSQPPTTIDAAVAVQERHAQTLLDTPGVVGIGVGLDAAGRPEIVVLLARADVDLPASLGGFGVRAEVTGPISAVHHREGHEQGGGGNGGGNGGDDGGNGGGNGGGDETDLTKRLDRPIPIGASTGNEERVALIACTTGTFGARVADADDTVYALSNNHVYAHENQASIGSKILQPGPADTGCATNDDDAIGSLFDFVPLEASGNTVDAAIAISDTSLIGNSTPSDGYGSPTSTTVDAFVGQNVQKYGRTTNLTTGVVSIVNLSIVVTYTTGPKVFEGQIGIDADQGTSFIESGDSGSLVVNDARNPVGLAFAGSGDGDFGVANPIDLVLEAFGVTIDGP